ncbi:DUF7525 family protein [Halobaculum sp. D14]|uniref:DUF7525 family protein n=1 Tax=unclassified Halobaculum TaxID=2640896 RepID=UPI003EC0735E
MATDTVSTDKSVGLALVFGAAATVGAGMMLAGATQELKAWGFALAMVAAVLAVTAIHVYDT